MFKLNFRSMCLILCMFFLTLAVALIYADTGSLPNTPPLPSWLTTILAALGSIGAVAGTPIVAIFWKKAKVVAQETQDLRDVINSFIFLYQDIITEVKDPKLILDAQNSLDAVAKTLEDTTITSLQKKAALVRALRAKLDKVTPA